MQYSWLAKNREKRLLVFCNGWGMDEKPYNKLTATGIDVLVLSDFSDLSSRDCEGVIPGIDAFGHYQERILLAWSMGVWAAHKLFARSESAFQRKIAVNGTLCPIHDRYGIPRELFGVTAQAWSESSKEKFYRRMCGEKNLTREFMDNAPARGIADQQRELNWYLEQVDCLSSTEAFYSEVWVSTKDRIMATENQLNFWGDDVRFVSGGHFPFYRKSCWHELLSSDTF